MVFKLKSASESPRKLIKTQIAGPHLSLSDSVGLGWEPIFYISNKFPADTDAFQCLAHSKHLINFNSWKNKWLNRYLTNKYLLNWILSSEMEKRLELNPLTCLFGKEMERYHSAWSWFISINFTFWFIFFSQSDCHIIQDNSSYQKKQWHQIYTQGMTTIGLWKIFEKINF